MINIETKSCPKCGEESAFKGVEPEYWSRTEPNAAGGYNFTERLKYSGCRRCGYELYTPTLDAQREEEAAAKRRERRKEKWRALWRRLISAEATRQD